MTEKDAYVTLLYKVGDTTVTEKCEITSQDAATVLSFIQSLPSVQAALPEGYQE